MGDPVLDLRPGRGLRFTWSGGTSCRVAAVEPPRRFAYRWYPGSEQHNDVIPITRHAVPTYLVLWNRRSR
jgi:uncharacterized protein YndB with AHSA1/START domain